MHLILYLGEHIISVTRRVLNAIIIRRYRYLRIFKIKCTIISTNSAQVPDFLFCINNEIIVYTENLGTYLPIYAINITI